MQALALMDLPDYDAALARAEQFATALLLTETYGKSPDAWEVRVTDERGQEVLAMPLSEVITKK